MLTQVLDQLIAAAARDEDDLRAARDEWDLRAGRVFDDEPLYEERSGLFLEWLTLDRPSATDGRGRTPAERCLEEERLSDDERRWAQALCRSQRSLYRVERVSPHGLSLQDLIGGARFEVSERRRLPAVKAGELFDARLVPTPQSPPELLFCRAFQFHATEASREIRRLVERARREGQSREELLFLLLRAQLRAFRWAHVPAARIYAAPDAEGPERFGARQALSSRS
jgi:hypothetical protein